MEESLFGRIVPKAGKTGYQEADMEAAAGTEQQRQLRDRELQVG